MIIRGARRSLTKLCADHGKTTLVDKMMRACNEQFEQERAMDSNAIEAERGITIMAKSTSVNYADHTINIVDTPGHADFGGEVERVLGMVDSVVLVVDATEGPMTQTKFVLSKALGRGLKPLVVLNKVDRESARIGEVEDEVFELFVSLGANDDQLGFPILYASARDSWAVTDSSLIKSSDKSLLPLLDTIIKYVPPPQTAPASDPFGLVVTMVAREQFLGRMVTGRIASGTVKLGDPIKVLSSAGAQTETCKVFKLLKRRGMERVELDSASTGDIITLCGTTKATVTDTVGSPELAAALPAVPIDPPTVTMTFAPNDSPLAGREGTKLTSQQIGDRLRFEVENNISINVYESKERGEAFEVQGRGEMQLGVLLENMRREGFELSVSPPTVVYKMDNGSRLEPQEEVNIEVDDEYSGVVIEKLSYRKGELVNMKPQPGGKTRLVFLVPSRGLLGYRSVFMVDTHGTGVMNRIFDSYVPYKGAFEKVRKGVLVSMDQGSTTTYALSLVEERGQLFITPQTEVYGYEIRINSYEFQYENETNAFIFV